MTTIGTKYCKSPLNYTGGKYKLLGNIMNRVPKETKVFVDLFCGGLNVGINSKQEKILINDSQLEVIDLFKNLAKRNSDEVLEKIDSIIKEYKLSKTNQEGYLKLRQDYNSEKSEDSLGSWDKFYVLIAYSFNNQIRFNKKGQFNMPFGKNRSSFNDRLRSHMTEFVDKLDDRFEFFEGDFDNNSLFNKIKESSEEVLIYADPPYRISTATYNENNGWTVEDDIRLFKFLDKCDKCGAKFMLSNVFEHNQLENKELKEWSMKYNVVYLDVDYSNCSYQKKETKNDTIEVIIKNY